MQRSIGIGQEMPSGGIPVKPKLFYASAALLIVLGLLGYRRFTNGASEIAQEIVKPTTHDESSWYDDYKMILAVYVDENGMVNYRELKAHPEKLDAFNKKMAALEREAFQGWSEKGRIAFLVNAYNALTLKVIVANYPIKSSFIRSLRFPKNSIRQIAGVWDSVKFRVVGKDMTLDEIEHENLRKGFKEPRIHMVLVCAAMGCPPLRAEPYTGEQLDIQLDNQAKRLLKNTQKFRIDRKKKRVYFSSIFKWFGKDFVTKYSPQSGFGKRNEEEHAVLNFVSQYLDKAEQEYLANGDYIVEYLEYDWSLNDQK